MLHPPYGDLPTGRSGSDLASASQTIHPKSSKRHTHCAGISAATCLVVALRPYRRSEAVPELPLTPYTWLWYRAVKGDAAALIWGGFALFLLSGGPRRDRGFPLLAEGGRAALRRQKCMMGNNDKNKKTKNPTSRKRTPDNSHSFSHSLYSKNICIHINLFDKYGSCLEAQIKHLKKQEKLNICFLSQNSYI